MRGICKLIAGVIAGASAVAQCQFSGVSVQTVGAGCNPVFAGNNPSIGGRLDTTACSLGLQVTAYAGCCNTWLRDRVLLLGLQQVNVPLPQVGSGCTLLARPDVLLWLPVSGGDTFSLALPPGLPLGFTVFVQAAAHYFTTIGFSDDFALSAGAQVTLN